MKRIKEFIKLHKVWSIATVALFVLIAATLIVVSLQKPSNTAPAIADAGQPPVVQKEENGLQLVALNKGTYGISTTSTFKLVTETETTVEEVQKGLTVVPSKTFSVESVSSQEFVVKFNGAFENDSIVKMAYSHNKVSEGWAFQTEKIFSVAGTLPSKDSPALDLNTGIELYFTKDAPQNISDYFTIDPEITGKFEVDGNHVIFIPDEDLIDGTEYTVTIGKGYGNEGETLAETYSFTFQTEQAYTVNPLDFYGVSTVLNESQQTLDLYVDEAQIKDTSIKMNIYTLKDAQTYIDGLNYIYSRTNSTKPFYKIFDEINYTDVASFETQIQTVPSDGGNNHFIDLPELLPRGYYLLEVIKNERTIYQLLQVCRYQTYLAVTEDQFLAWVVDPVESQPVEGFEVALEGKSLGTTDASGLLVVPMTTQQDIEKNWFPQITDLEGNAFVIDMRANNYYNPYYDSYYHTNGDSGKKYWSYLYTDRTVYLPTDTIQVFGFVQKMDKNPLSEVEVRMVDNGTVLDSKGITLSENGSFVCQFELSNYLDYSVGIEVYDGDQLVEKKWVQASFFEKPTYNLETEVSKAYVLSGDTVGVTAKEQFFEGTPVAGATIEMTTTDSFDGVDRATLTCDENGVAQKNITPMSAYATSWEPYFYSLYFVSDEFEKNYSNFQDGFIFFPRDCMLELDCTPIVGDTFQVSGDFSNITLDHFQGLMYENDSFRGEPLPDKILTVSIVESYYKKTFRGQIYDYINKVSHDQYDYTYTESIISTEEIQTDVAGHFTFEFTKPVSDRYYTFEFSTIDGQGQTITQNISCTDSRMNYYNTEPVISIRTDSEYYKKNASITASIYSDEQLLEDTAESCALFLTCKDGIISYGVSDQLTKEFSFDEDYISNAFVLGIYFDGTNLVQLWQKGIYYDTTEAALNIEITPDQLDYAPRDIAHVNIKVTDAAGNPVKGDVNLSVVDEAYFALFQDNSQPLEELYEYVFSTGILRDKLFKATGQHHMNGNAEKGGGGDGAIRNDFDSTAYFDTVETDAQGNANASFTLPDSLTSWRITATALSSDLKAGKNKDNINCKLPFFITDVLFDTYLSQDEISATLIAAGSSVTADQDIEYTATTEDAKGQKTISETKGKGLYYTDVPLGKLAAGTYTVTIRAKSGSNSDAIQKTIHVVDTQQLFQLTEKAALTENMNFVSNDNLVKLTFLNEDAAWQYQQILNIYQQSGSRRADIQAAALTAANYLNKTYGSDLSVEFMDDFKDTNQGFVFSEIAADTLSGDTYVDHQITAFVLLSDLYKDHAKWFTDEALDNLAVQLKNQMISTETTSENNYASMWALAIMNQPVLLDASKAIESDAFVSDELNFEKLYTLLTFIELGDLKNAKAIYADLVDKFGTKGQDTIFMAGDDQKKFTALTMLAALKLGILDDADAMYKKIESLPEYKFPTNMECLEYFIAKQPKNTTCSFKYSTTGASKEVSLSYLDACQLALTPEEADSIHFSNIIGNVSVISDFIGTVEDIEPKSDLKITRTYKVNGAEVTDNNLNQGDFVEVCLTVQLPANLSAFEINDLLPAGLVYYDYTYSDNFTSLVAEGNHIKINGYSFRQKTVTINYRAVAIAKGSYTADYPVVKNLYSNEANYDIQKTLTIN